LFGGDKAESKGQTGALVRTEERKDFRQKGGYQGGFGIKPTFRTHNCHKDGWG
jgi:hypothetical protein